MRNLFLLPTNKPSRLFENVDGDLSLIDEIESDGGMMTKNQHIYIVSNIQISIKDWYLVELFKITGESDGFHVEKCVNLNDVWCNNSDVISTRHILNCKKIVLTTDQDLINEGVQSIDDEFLNLFIKQSNCNSVELYRFGFDDSIIKQDKKWYINLHKEEICPICEKNKLVDGVCEQCTDELCKPITIEQETIEEAANRLYPDLGHLNEFYGNLEAEIEQPAFIEGAKWQAKKTYSEEEMLTFGKACFYKGFDKSENDDANCYTAFREQISGLFKPYKK